ncbi:MAG: hypothetical protein SFU86_19435 [Pirellulaceae bacterium]|nr:hypothetical protein [Pirellulaceae bacterium]
MKSLLLFSWLLVGAEPPADGTLIFLENCNSFVEFATRGEIGHVAIALADERTPWVYEATPGHVRRVAAAEYLAELARLNERRREAKQIRVWSLAPQSDYCDEEIARMREYLDGQLGRRYSVKNYVVGEPGDGIHCAELAASTLNASGRFAFDECHRIHPTALHRAVLPQHAPATEIALASLAQEAWCLRAQRRWGGWFSWCGWSCGEAWSFCW